MVLAEQEIRTSSLHILYPSSKVVAPRQWKQKERVFDNFSPDNLTVPIAKWIFARPSMQQENKDVAFMAVRLYDEIFELLAEHERPSSMTDIEALEKEALDVLFFVISLSANQPHSFLEELDLVTLSHSMNGQGGRSDIFDRMAEIAANLPFCLDLRKDIREFLKLWFSYVRHSPLRRSPDQILKSVLNKNGTEKEGNYPEIVFSGKDPETGQELNPDENHMQQQHGRFALRMLREAFGYPAGGLKWHHIRPYLKYITGFKKSAENLQMLRVAVKLDVESQQRVEDYQRLVQSNSTQSFESSLRLRNSS